MIKFGKKAQDILSIKKNFLLENKKLFSWQKKLFKIYNNQPKRKFCKNCERKLAGSKFRKLNIVYVICNKCGHFNGIKDDTKKLSEIFYQTSEQKKYSSIYKEAEKKNYINRVKKIYIPKVQFFLDVLKKYISKKHINNMEFIDIGCGSGYYISAMKRMGIKNFWGIDPSKSMVDYGNKINKFKKLNFVDHTKTVEVIKSINSKKNICISMIGSLEHIYNQNEILKKIKRNKKVKFLYIVVPCFSPSSIIELVFNNNFQRLLAPQHTHLYTYKSLKFLEKKFNLKIIGEWWFGADIVDLFRNFYISIQKNKENKNNLKIFENMFLDLLDPIQLTIDKKKLSSEAHLIFKVN